MATAVALSAQKSEAPTATAIDDMCLAVDTAQVNVDAAQAALKEVKAPLLAAVREFGSVPESAPRTKRLVGTLYIADSTVSTKTEIVDESVVALRTKLKDIRKSQLFAEMFDTIESFQLKQSAVDILKIGIAAMPDAKQAEILTLFAKCFYPKPSAPSLSVELAQVLREREEKAAQKAADKAAKAEKKAAREAKKGGAK